jgi:hypothetical protein
MPASDAQQHTALLLTDKREDVALDNGASAEQQHQSHISYSRMSSKRSRSQSPYP